MSFLFIYSILLSTYYLEHLLSRNVWFTGEYNDIPDKNPHSYMRNRQVLLSCSVTSVMSNSVQPHRRKPTRLPRPWDSPGKNNGVGYHFLLQCMKGKVKVKLLSHVWLLALPWTAAYQAPLSMGFSRWEYWSGLPLPSACATCDT